MSFFFGQEHLSILQWVIRAVVGYIFLMIVSKCLGNRIISQLHFLDFVVALLIGNILAHPLSDEGLGMTGSMTTTVVIAALYIGGLYVTMKYKRFQKIFEPDPIVIIRDGEILYRNIYKVRISEKYVLTELRLQQIDDIKKVQLALWESTGQISIMLMKENNPITLKDIKLLQK